MAEVLGIASGIAGLLSLTIEVYAISARYISGVKNASSAIQEILRELKALKTVLTQLDKLAEKAEFEQALREQASAFFSIEDVEEYRKILVWLQSNLEKQASQSGFSAKLKTLAWPFSDEKTSRMVEILRRYVGNFGQALTIDTLYDLCLV
jgi:hypothetical protein